MNKINDYPIPQKCDNCGGLVILTTNAAIYGKEYGNGKCYKCTNCDSYVGVHDGTITPLGRLADKEMRALKKRCHALFDPVWKEHKYISRSQAYTVLADALNIPAGECHFGWFDKDMLARCLDIINKKNWFKTKYKTKGGV